MKIPIESAGMTLPAILFMVLFALSAGAGATVCLRQRRLVRNAVRLAEEKTRELAAANVRAEEAEGRLKALTGRLEEKDLEKTNLREDLRNSRQISEEYATLFMEYSRLNITNIQSHYLKLRNLAIQGNLKGILKKLDSGDAPSESMKIFYSKFDDAILNIYPTFVESVNALLTEEGQIVLKAGERLTTELRVLALIRMGINDSEKISQFLHCSLSTIYTYRSKLKRRAKDPESFENAVEAIGQAG